MNLSSKPLAMAYVPWQHLDRIYENLEEAYLWYMGEEVE